MVWKATQNYGAVCNGIVISEGRPGQQVGTRASRLGQGGAKSSGRLLIASRVFRWELEPVHKGDRLPISIQTRQFIA